MPDGTAVAVKYDAVGRKMENSITTNSIVSALRYLYDAEDIVAVLDKDNNLVSQFTHGPGIDEPLTLKTGTTNYYYHADGLGSIAVLSDTNGAIAETIEYQAYGKPVFKNAAGTQIIRSALGNIYSYTAREYDDVTGLIDNRLRTRDPNTGAFIQEDPIGFAGGDVNLYAYVGGNPINFVDPLGLWSVSLEAYAGVGGGLVFGFNPGGGGFITGRFGVGLGGGLSFNHKGKSSGWDPCEHHSLLGWGRGGYSTVNGALGPFYIGRVKSAGVNFEGLNRKPYNDNSSLEYGGDFGHFGLRGGIAAGGEITLY